MPASPPRPRRVPPRCTGAVRTTRALAAALFLAAAASPGRAGQPVTVDGYLHDWGGSPIAVDALGDGGGGGVDFRRLYATDDDDWLFVRFQTTSDVLLEEGSNIALYIDADANPVTGSQLGDIGAELRWNFGARSGTFYGNPPSDPVDWRDIDLRFGPSTSASEFEVAIGRDVRPDGIVSLFDGDHIRIMIRDEAAGGDRVPDAGKVADFTFTHDGPAAPGPIALERLDGGHLRIVSHNVLQDSPWGGGQSARYDRIYSAVDPDVICWQEIYGHSAGDARNLVETWLPSEPGEFWFAAQQFDRVTVSRYPVITRWSIDNNLAILLPTTADIGRDVLLINCHLPCCENDAGRQSQVDAIMAFLGDALTPGGDVDVPEGTGVVITGDMNFVGDRQQLVTLVTGDIVNEGVFGPDVVPDWDGTNLKDLAPIQTERRMAFTWYRESSTFSPGRLDYMIYTDSVLGVGNRFLLFTDKMAPDQLAAYGLFAGDTEIASDHLPVVFDLYDGPSAVATGEVAPARTSRLVIGPNPLPKGTIALLAFDDPGVALLEASVFDTGGRLVRHLSVTGDPPARLEWDGRDGAGRQAASGVYWVELRGAGVEGRLVVARGALAVVG